MGKNMKKYLKKAFLGAAVLICAQAMAVNAEETYQIIDFVPLEEEAKAYHLDQNDKPSLETLCEEFPDQLEVYVEGQEEPVLLDVTWECVGEDYEATDAYYYQFSPAFETADYTLEESLNLYTDAPYIAVFLYDGDQGLTEAVDIDANMKEIYNFLIKDLGMNTAAACGVMANIHHESAFNPNAAGDKNADGEPTSYGLCQWHNARWESLKTWCGSNGYDWTTVNGQMNYLKYEMSKNNWKVLWNGRTIYNNMLSMDNSAAGAFDGGYYWCYNYEVPANKEQVALTRGNLARDVYWTKYKNGMEGTSAYAGKFKDVTFLDYYYDSVLWAIDKNVTKGKSATTFAPKDTCTRAEAITFLWRAAGSPEPQNTENPFTDITENMFCYKAVLWAVENGITTGDSETTFGPKENVKRSQVVSFIYRAKGNPSFTESDAFEDVPASHWSYPAVIWAVESGITTGKSDTIFEPWAHCTRNEIVTFLYRAYK